MENKVKFSEAIKYFWTKAFDYKSNAGFREYWLVTLFQGIILLLGVVILLVGENLYNNGNIFSKRSYIIPTAIIVIYLLVSVIPWISLNVRRLHDTGKSGWWTLLLGLLGIGLAVLLLLCTLRANSNSFIASDNTAVCVYGPPEFFEEEITPGSFELTDPRDIPIEVYGPPEFFEEEENDDDQ